MVDSNHPRISIVRQCRLVSIARSSFYYAGTGGVVALLGPVDASAIGVRPLRLRSSRTSGGGEVRNVSVRIAIGVGAVETS